LAGRPCSTALSERLRLNAAGEQLVLAAESIEGAVLTLERRRAAPRTYGTGIDWRVCRGFWPAAFAKTPLLSGITLELIESRQRANLARREAEMVLCHIRTFTAEGIATATSAVGLLVERVEQGLCILEIRRPEAFGEPAVNGCKKTAGFGGAALVAAEPGEAHSGAQSQSLAPCSSAMRRASRYSSSATSECPCRRSSWPFFRFNSAANQHSPVLPTICNASSNSVTASSIWPQISHAPARRAPSTWRALPSLREQIGMSSRVG
jgi:hypothetical protein